jgi:hypothetical protein
MQEGTGNGGFGSALADAGFDFSPVNPAFPWAEDAVRLERLERFERPLDPADLFRSIHHEPFYQNFPEIEERLFRIFGIIKLTLGAFHGPLFPSQLLAQTVAPKELGVN